MAALSRGKRMVKTFLDKQGMLKCKHVSPDSEAGFYCWSGIDKDEFQVKYISDYKGFGVFRTCHTAVGDFIFQYVGEKITLDAAREREKKSSENKMFFYKYNGKLLEKNRNTTFVGLLMMPLTKKQMQ